MISRSISSSSTPLHSQVRAALGLHQGYVLCCEQWSMRKTSVRHHTERKCHRSAQDKRHICITAPWPQGSHKHHRRWGKKTPRARSQGGPEQNSDFCCPRELTYLHRGKPSNIPRSSRQGLRSPHSQPRSYWQVMGAGKGKSVFLRGVALVSWPHSSGWLYAPEYTENTNWLNSFLKRKKRMWSWKDVGR